MFDPFNDFESVGYLRNIERLKDRHEIDRQQHLYFRAGLNQAASALARCKPVSYAHFCEVHRILFGGFYPWAGSDRRMLGVGDIISKREGEQERVRFEESRLAQSAVEEGLRIGNNPHAMAKRPGHVMGYFAWGHPFLDGNGRTMMVVHAELLHRAGYVIDWSISSKGEYLSALTRELVDPHQASLDAYMRPLLRPADPRFSWIDQLSAMPGLDGGDSDSSDAVSYSSKKKSLVTVVCVLAVKVPALEPAGRLLCGTLERLHLHLRCFGACQVLQIVAHDLVQALAHVLRCPARLLGDPLVHRYRNVHRLLQDMGAQWIERIQVRNS